MGLIGNALLDGVAMPNEGERHVCFIDNYCGVIAILRKLLRQLEKTKEASSQMASFKLLG
jgi:hypothetical protein